jgi:hypothetical protein
MAAKARQKNTGSNTRLLRPDRILKATDAPSRKGDCKGADDAVDKIQG